MINVGIIGRNFGYKVIFRALKKIKDFRIFQRRFSTQHNKNFYYNFSWLIRYR